MLVYSSLHCNWEHEFNHVNVNVFQHREPGLLMEQSMKASCAQSHRAGVVEDRQQLLHQVLYSHMARYWDNLMHDAQQI